MSSSLRKQSVNLASGEVRVSRIRRDPPPKVKEKVVDPKERDRWDAVVGITAVTIAVLVIIYAISSYNGWSLRQYTVEM